MTQATGGSVRSEIGRLETVLLHRPGTELLRITPSNKDELLFDELLWVEHAQREHDAFADVLRRAGAEVCYMEDLLAEVLVDEALAAEVVARHVTDKTCGPQAVDLVRDFLLALPVTELVDHLIGGVSLEEVGLGEGLVAAVSAPTEMLLQPLPNTVFTRDSSGWIGEGVVLSPMSRLVRRRETDLLRLIYQRHPRFAGTPIWFGGEPIEHYPATFEGGDLLVVADRGLAVGISERTTPSGVEALSARLFEADVADRILVVDLPKVRAAMHLDTIVTQVDVDAFITYPSMTPSLRTWRVTPGDGRGGRRVDSGDGRGRGRVDSRDRRGGGQVDPREGRSGAGHGPAASGAKGGVRVTPEHGLLRGLAWAAGLDHVRAIEPALGSTRAEREQWNDANNTLALAPGEVVAYERNVATNDVLASAGMHVHTIPSYELPRGRGGPRCMSCPVRRAPLPAP